MFYRGVACVRVYAVSCAVACVRVYAVACVVACALRKKVDKNCKRGNRHACFFFAHLL